MHKVTWINWSVEFGPIVLFFLSLKLVGESDAGFVFSTAVFTAATVVSLITAYLRDRRIALFPIVTGAFVIGFGVTTVIFKEPHIFIIKDSIYNGLFAIAMLIGLTNKKALLKDLFASLFDMSDEGWRILTIRWMIMFALLAISNELVWRMYSQETWVVYKFFATIITAIFGFYQLTLSKKHRNPTASPLGMREVNIDHKK